MGACFSKKKSVQVHPPRLEQAVVENVDDAQKGKAVNPAEQVVDPGSPAEPPPLLIAQPSVNIFSFKDFCRTLSNLKKKRDPELTQELLLLKDAHDEYQNTLLHLACYFTGYLELVKLMLIAAYDPWSENKDGFWPIENAFCRKNGEVFEYLKSLLNMPVEPLQLSLNQVVLFEEPLLGEGTHARVLQGRFQGMPVAVKQFKDDPISLRAFDNEKRFSKLRHENLIRSCGFSTSREGYCLVMELVMYGSLSSFLKSDSEIPPTLYLSFLCDLTQGLNFLHEQGIRHRDITSSNVLIDGNFRLKLADFGAAAYDHEFSGRKEKVGSVLYMAPEILIHATPHKHSDIYSLAILFLEIFLRKHPSAEFQEPELKSKLQKHERPSIPKNMPIIIANLIKDCWNQAPTKRPDTASILKSLTDFGQKLPVSQKEYSWLGVENLGQYAKKKGLPELEARLRLVNHQVTAHYLLNQMLGQNHGSFFQAVDAAKKRKILPVEELRAYQRLNHLANQSKHDFRGNTPDRK